MKKAAIALTVLFAVDLLGGDRPPRYPMLSPCPGIQGGLCGSLEVREDRSKPEGRRIPIRVAVIPATGDNAASDPLYIIAGGGPGMASLPEAEAHAKLFGDLHRTRDFVFIDQRGTGQSNPLACPFGDPVAAVRAFLGGEVGVEKVQACRKALENKADLRMYTTTAAADDMEEVRRWLGHGKINLYGGSYASRLAYVYSHRYPAQVRTVTMKAATPFAIRNPLFTARDSQAALDRLFADCRADEACNRAYPDLPTQFTAVLGRLTEKPAQLTAGETRISLTAAIFGSAIRRMLYAAESQRAVPLAIASAFKGDYSRVARPLSAGTFIDRALHLGLFLSVTCSEDVQFSRAEVESATRGTFTGAILAGPLVEACKGWPVGSLPPALLRGIENAPPAIVISGALDPQTPPVWGREMAGLVPGSLHIEIAGMSHSGSHPCLAGVITEFVSEGSAKELSTKCLDDIRRPPFVLPE